MNLTRFDLNHATIEDINAAMDEFGYVILDNALSAAHVEKLKDELEPHFAKRADCQAHFFGFKTKRIEALFAKSKITQHMAVHPTVLAVTDHILGAKCDSFQVNLTQGIRINPGEKAQIIHPDSALFPISNKPFEFQVNTIWAYSSFRKENGATQLVPGSHKWPEGRTPQPHEITYAEMDPGSVLIYAASLLHGGGANVTQEPRTGIVVSYCLGWLRQSENQYLSYPPAIAKTFGEQLQRLIGYNVHKPNLGWVHGHDPMDLLTGKDNSQIGAEEFLTQEQVKLMEEYYATGNAALTSHNLQEAELAS
jgi:ectoine hydroxylase-related dioxygenase (phytanoyl-CoA dioxygenase family)